MCKKGSHLGLAHLIRIQFFVEKDEPFDPVHIRLLGPDTVVMNTDRLPELGEKRRIVVVNWHEPSMLCRSY